jgi:hypothetical protein
MIIFFLNEMAKHPKVMEKAQAKARQVFANVDEAGLHKLDHLQLLIKETLEHTPNSFAISKRKQKGM